ATIAIVRGAPCIGLERAQLEHLARNGSDFGKAGAGDLAAFIARGRDGATTVSATAFLAARAGIRVFATGGIGGVHRGDSGDISNDINTLAEVACAVVSAGAKAILDLPRTVEMLETRGVLVLGYRTDRFPAFYTRDSGLAVEHRVDEPDEIAAILRVRFDELKQNGVLIANPIPAADELASDEIAATIERALQAAADQGVAGKALTPFLLARIAETTGGTAVAANRALAVNNARLAAEVAAAYARTGGHVAAGR
ncbi:MAG: pseudouridine-5'-phosphate glycosidase, partial [Myxococcota bacterium]